MINIKNEDLLKATPEYEEYDKNEAKLTVEELRENGLIKCGGCCSTKGGKSSCGCGSRK
ncbi:hypothetical protein H9660_01395 [Clostridium sp. Sa3CUN1]|uniref:Lantibiotic n=1 Tax=Clostridium gallinarum TaxID=2762246 RepID=A0ABR8Q058_9CLOT|nr:hypothetical protein [Clostridium gallinarum]MBD7913795.1 hypothetical protein [Clostridium gallinarum]